MALDTGNLAVLTLLALSAAFDIVDRATLLRRFIVTYGLNGAVLSCFRSYLIQRSYVHRSSAAALLSRRPFPAVSRKAQSSGRFFPTLHRRFVGDHRTLTAWPHSPSVCRRHADLRLLSLRRMSCSCRSGFRVAWMTLRKSNRLQLSTAKTEVLWCAFIRSQHQISQPGLHVGVDVIVSSASVRDLGKYLDCDVSMRTHVSKVMSSCFAVLRRLRRIRSSVMRPVFVSLVVSLIFVSPWLWQCHTRWHHRSVDGQIAVSAQRVRALPDLRFQ